MTVRGSELRLREGEWLSGEITALQILEADRRKSKDQSFASKQFWLTPDQLEMRLGREVYNSNGFPEAHIRQGIYGRAYNPLMGKRPGGKFDPYGTMGFDGRVPHGHDTMGNVWMGDQWYGRSPWWADSGNHGLDRYQRCRIRAALRKARDPFTVRAELAERYGVPTYVIARLAITSRTCHT